MTLQVYETYIDEISKTLQNLTLPEFDLEKYLSSKDLPILDINYSSCSYIDGWEVHIKLDENKSITQILQEITRELKLVEAVKSQEAKDKYLKYVIINDWYILKNNKDCLFKVVDPKTKEISYCIHLCKDIGIYYIN